MSLFAATVKDSACAEMTDTNRISNRNDANKTFFCGYVHPDQTTSLFKAHKNGTDQTISTGTFTQCTLGTEVWDVGSNFASNAWTPPAGKVSMVCNLGHLWTNNNSHNWAEVRKNGTSIRSVGQDGAGNSNWDIMSFVVQDIANGSDVYTVYGYIESQSGGTATFNGSSSHTNFSGVWLGL